ncbi:glycosyltransferase family 9 protein, partial [Ramlibacter sp.]|uniref:glycosyltransferase family 9 protein n=1 Tax=Ramlibacter sp. TaxID=1917967 RepID=UPI0017B2BCED
MNILIVKLSSLGDVVHAMPAVQDIRAALPDARIDWVVERGFAPLVQRCEGVAQTIPSEIRRWRKALLAKRTREEWAAFREQLQARAYDAVIDLQGLTKSAVVARMARLAPGGSRYALANQTDGSSYEVPTRWVADVAVPVAPRVHAVQRSRLLCAQALGYTPAAAPRFG